MLNKVVLVRRESFGGTALAKETGKRFYVDNAEFHQIEQFGVFPQDVQEEVIGAKVVILHPQNLPLSNFSAPDTVFFEVTRACNLHCIHCFNDSGLKLSDELTNEDRHAIVDQLAKFGVQEIRFTGGEPLALPGIYNLISDAVSRNLRVSLGSNGVLISSVIAKRLANLGVNQVIVSLDGNQVEHDAIRGRGSFDKTMKALTHLKNVGISTRVNCVVMKSNINSIIPLVENLVNNGESVMLRRLIPSGRASEDWAEMLDVDDYQTVQSILQPLHDEFSGKVEGHYLFTKSFKPRVDIPFERRNCSAGHRGMVVLPNGDVQTCGFLGPLGEKSVGKMPRESINQIWERLNTSNHIGAMQQMTSVYNQTTPYPKTNCLAMGLASGGGLVQIGRR